MVYDFFTHGSGDAFTVDSYSASVGQMEYDDIPTYTATRVDPDEPEPTGIFDLRDCFDFRPAVENIAGASTTLSDADQITGNSFDFFHRQYDGTGASTVDTPKSLQVIFKQILNITLVKKHHYFYYQRVNLKWLREYLLKNLKNQKT